MSSLQYAKMHDEWGLEDQARFVHGCQGCCGMLCSCNQCLSLTMRILVTLPAFCCAVVCCRLPHTCAGCCYRLRLNKDESEALKTHRQITKQLNHEKAELERKRNTHENRIIVYGAPMMLAKQFIDKVAEHAEGKPIVTADLYQYEIAVKLAGRSLKFVSPERPDGLNSNVTSQFSLWKAALSFIDAPAMLIYVMDFEPLIHCAASGGVEGVNSWVSRHLTTIRQVVELHPSITGLYLLLVNGSTLLKALDEGTVDENTLACWYPKPDSKMVLSSQQRRDRMQSCCCGCCPAKVMVSSYDNALAELQQQVEMVEMGGGQSSILTLPKALREGSLRRLVEDSIRFTTWSYKHELHVCSQEWDMSSEENVGKNAATLLSHYFVEDNLTSFGLIGGEYH